MDFEIIRDKIPIYSVDASYMVNDNTGYIKLNNFSSTSIKEIKTAVFNLKSKGNGKSCSRFTKQWRRISKDSC